MRHHHGRALLASPRKQSPAPALAYHGRASGTLAKGGSFSFEGRARKAYAQSPFAPGPPGAPRVTGCKKGKKVGDMGV